MLVERYEVRSRSGAEVAFSILRVLVGARLLWARDGALPVEALPALASVPPSAIAVALERLCAEGVAELAPGTQTVRLTERAARELAETPSAAAAHGSERPAAA